MGRVFLIILAIELDKVTHCQRGVMRRILGDNGKSSSSPVTMDPQYLWPILIALNFLSSKWT
jgi:hypothetical protein